MGSTRLPGKVLLPVLGKPLLEFQIERLRRVRSGDALAVATSELPADDAIARFCRRLEVSCYRGSESDVLDRYHRCAREIRADVVVRSTADCPLIDPGLVERVIQEFLDRGDCDYGSNATLHRTYPRGLDVEVFSFKALAEAAGTARDPYEREHVTPFLIARPERYRSFSMAHEEDLSALRWTVDTPEDFELIERILSALYPRNPEFTWLDVLDLVDRNPQWSQLNAHVEQKHR